MKNNREVRQIDIQKLAIVISIIMAILCTVILIMSSDNSMRNAQPLEAMLMCAGCSVGTLLGVVICTIYEAHNIALSVWALGATIVFAGCTGIAGAMMITNQILLPVVMLFTACGIAIVLSIVRLIVNQPKILGMSSTSLTVAVIVMFACAFTIWFNLPQGLLAGVLVSVGIGMAQMMANFSVHVPERYILQWRKYMTQRWTVRGEIPSDARELTRKDMRQEMQLFLARYTTGIVWSVVLSIVGFAMLAWNQSEPTLYARIGLTVLACALVLFFELKPRLAGRAFERYLMRLCGLCIGIIAILGVNNTILTLGNMTLQILMWGSMAIGLIFVLTIFAQNSDFYSLLMSRLGDGLCFISIMIIPVASFFAAGLFEFLRGYGW